jgi:hypothetical protein
VDFKDWITIGLGGVVGIATSIFANLWHPKIIGWLDSRKLLSSEKRRSKALVFDKRVRALHSGEEDKVLFFLTGNAQITLGISVAMMCVLLCMFSIASSIASVVFKEQFASLSEANAVRVVLLGGAILFLIGAAFTYSVMLKAIEHMRELRSALDNFAKYDAEFRESWGEPPAPDSE